MPFTPGESSAPDASDAPASAYRKFLTGREDQVFLVLTLLIGALVGLVVVAFILLTENFSERLYPAGSPAWHRIFIPILGSLAMGYLLFRFFPNARGSGVPQTKAALYAADGKIAFKTVFGKFFCTSATLASGIPLGREGPSVQVGAGIASLLGRKLGLSTEKVKALIPVGAAAAVAAAFNTPLAAVLFSLEEVVGDLHAPVLGSVVLASATSWAVLRLMLGNHPLFTVPQYQLVHPVEFALYAVLGVVGGLVSAAFSGLLLKLREKFLAAPRKTLPFQPVIGGVLVGLAGWVVPQTLGVGYAHVGEALNGNMAWKLMALLLAMKLVSVAVSYASGNAGGIFGPSLFLGAMLGGVVGTAGHYFFPNHVASSGAYALVGMGTAFAGIVRAPMTSVMMIFEITRDYAVIVPLMISNLVSFFIASRFQKPIYEVLAHQDGIHLPTPESRMAIGSRQVISAMQPAAHVLRAGHTIGESLRVLEESKLPAWPVCDAHGVNGVLGRVEISAAAADGLKDKKIESLLTSENFPHLHADHPLDAALDRMGSSGLDALPVVSRANVHKLLGVVTFDDVLAQYRKRPAITPPAAADSTKNPA